MAWPLNGKETVLRMTQECFFQVTKLICWSITTKSPCCVNERHRSYGCLEKGCAPYSSVRTYPTTTEDINRSSCLPQSSRCFNPKEAESMNIYYNNIVHILWNYSPCEMKDESFKSVSTRSRQFLYQTVQSLETQLLFA